MTLNPYFLVAIVLILFGYFVQATAAFVHGSSAGILEKAFSKKRFVDTWLVVATIFFGPLVISWISGIVEMYNYAPEKIWSSLVNSMLLIFVTLEFSQLGSLTRKNRDWRTLLLIALFLDIATIILITAVSSEKDPTVALVFALGFFAFLSSFMIILFAKIAGDENG